MRAAGITSRGATPAVTAGRVARLPRRIVPYLAYPVLTWRMMRSADLRRSPYMSNVFLLSPARKPWRVAIAGVVVMVLLAVYVPIARLVILVSAIGEATVVAWYRWSNGSRRLQAKGLPPGRLMIPIFTPLLDPDFFQEQWQRHGPLFTTNMLYTPTVAVGGLEFGTRILRDHHDSLRPPAFSHSDGVEGGAVRNQSGERHQRSRSAFTRAFAPAMVAAARPFMERAVRRQLSCWSTAETAAETTGPEIRTGAERLVLDAWITVFFGVDPEREPSLHDRLVALCTNFDYIDPERRHQDDSDEIISIVRALATRADELAPSAVRTLVERSPEALDDPVLISNLVHVLHTTRFDMAGLLTWIVHHLAHHDTWCREVRESSSDDAAGWVVSETLRLSQSEHVLRETTCPISVEGFTIPAGWWLRVLVRQSHRDPAVFDQPERFDPCRFANGKPPRSAYSPFGLDAHGCLGESLVRMMATVFVREVTSEVDLHVENDGPPMFNGYHFWAPSEDLRVQFAPVRP